MRQQTILPFGIEDDASLESFHAEGNETLIRELSALMAGRRRTSVLYLWGERGSGKTHLLNGFCLEAKKKQLPHFYFPVAPGGLNDNADINALDKIHPRSLVCVDDIHHLSGNFSAQQWMLGLYEKVISGGGGMVAASTLPLDQINFELRDLASRLSSGGIFNLHVLSDDSKRVALRLRAERRGFTLSDHVLDFIMTHYERDTASLFSLLDRIDSASLSAHRKITVPFIKSLL